MQLNQGWDANHRDIQQAIDVQVSEIHCYSYDTGLAFLFQVFKCLIPGLQSISFQLSIHLILVASISQSLLSQLKTQIESKPKKRTIILQTTAHKTHQP